MIVAFLSQFEDLLAILNEGCAAAIIAKPIILGI